MRAHLAIALALLLGDGTTAQAAVAQAPRPLRISVRSEGSLRGGGDPISLNASTGVVIDAGSSGSRAYVFRWLPSDPAGTIVEVASLRIKPGMSTHARERGGAAAAQSLLPLLEFVLDQPGVRLEATPVHFMATAGMRLLEPALREEVLAAVEQLLLGSPFLTARPGECARVLSGEQEALDRKSVV